MGRRICLTITPDQRRPGWDADYHALGHYIDPARHTQLPLLPDDLDDADEVVAYFPATDQGQRLVTRPATIYWIEQRLGHALDVAVPEGDTLYRAENFSVAPSAPAPPETTELSEDDKDELWWCHWCGRSRQQAEQLVSALGNFICVGCARELDARRDEHGVIELPLVDPAGRPDARDVGVGRFFGSQARQPAQVLPLAELRARLTEDGTLALRCAFCGKSEEAVRAMFYAGLAAICDECVNLASEVGEPAG